MTKSTTKWTGAAVGIVVLGTVGCQSESRSDTLPSASSVPSAHVAMGRVDDATKTNIVLRQLHAVNQSEIDAGRLAVDRAQSAEIKRFGAEMSTDHATADQKLTDLAKRMNIDLSMSMTQDPVEEALSSAADEQKRALRAISGPHFDVVYLAPQVSSHEFALRLVDEGEKTASGDAKKLLEELRPVIEAHRDHAKSLMQDLSFSPAGVGGGPAPSAAPPSMMSAQPGMGKAPSHTPGGSKENP